MQQINVALLILLCVSSYGASVTTGQYNIQRSGANTGEALLTTANVAVGFGKKGTFATDGNVYAQPLVAETGIISGVTHILILATMHNSLYAYDADNPGHAVLWHVNVGTSMTAYPGIGDGFTYGAEIGCMATPVIDPSANVVYEACTSSSGAWSLYSFNLLDGSTFHSAVAIAGTSNGLTFDSTRQLQRNALLFANGNVYFAFAGYADQSPYQGWVFAYNSATLAQVAAWCDVNHPGVSGNSYDCSSNCGAAGIWMAGGGMAADGSGNVYLITGNGDWDGTVNFGESFVKLSSTLAVLDYMTPSNWASLNSTDKDLGSSRVLLAGSLVLGGGKDGKWWVLNQGAMGQLQGGGGPAIPQVFATSSTAGIWGGVAFANATLFVSGWGTPISSYAFNGSTFTTTATAQTGNFAYPGATIAYSSNGASNGIVWAVTVAADSNSTPRAGTLRAFNASTLSEIYNSGTKSADSLGTYAKFATPTVANGSVYVSTFSGSVVVYGLLPTSQQRGISSHRGSAVVR